VKGKKNHQEDDDVDNDVDDDDIDDDDDKEDEDTKKVFVHHINNDNIEDDNEDDDDDVDNIPYVKKKHTRGGKGRKRRGMNTNNNNNNNNNSNSGMNNSSMSSNTALYKPKFATESLLIRTFDDLDFMSDLQRVQSDLDKLCLVNKFRKNGVLSSVQERHLHELKMALLMRHESSFSMTDSKSTIAISSNSSQIVGNNINNVDDDDDDDNDGDANRQNESDNKNDDKQQQQQQRDLKKVNLFALPLVDGRRVSYEMFMMQLDFLLHGIKNMEKVALIDKMTETQW